MENPFPNQIEQKDEKGTFDLESLDLEKIARLEELEPYHYEFKELVSGKILDGLVSIHKNHFDPEAIHAPMYKGVLEIEYTDPQTKERIGKFGGTMVRGWMDYDRKYSKATPERNDKDFWTIYYRRVDEARRRKGVGSLLLKRFEEVAQKLKSVELFKEAEWMQVTTGLASLSNLLLSKGFQVHPADQERLQSIIDSAAVELEDIPSHQRDILLIKDF